MPVHPIVACLGLLLTTSAATAAGDNPPAAAEPDAEAWDPSAYPKGFLPLDTFHFGLVMGSGVGWLSSTRPPGAEAVGPMMDFVGTLEFFDLLSLAVSADWIFTKDDSLATVQVVDASGQVSTRQERLSYSAVGLAGGLRTPDFRLAALPPLGIASYTTSAFLRAGHGWTTGGTSTPGCIDCPTTTYGTVGVPFVEMGAHIGLRAAQLFSTGLVLGYRYYFPGSTIDGQFQIALSTTFM